jgi:hypothetical protein
MTMVRVLRVIGCTGVGMLLLAAPVSAAPSTTITPTSIGGLRLDWRAGAYTHALHEKPFVTRYGNGTKRLLFSKAQVSVFLGRSGLGTRITTAAQDYTLRGGAGPCSRFDRLARAQRLTPYALAGPLGPVATVYRRGKLWFTLSDPTHVGSVTLAAGKPPLASLVNEPQCRGGKRPPG